MINTINYYIYHHVVRYIEDKDDYYNTLTEYLLLTVEGQAYIQDIKFDKMPFNDYNITVCKKKRKIKRVRQNLSLSLSLSYVYTWDKFQTSQIPVQHIPISTTSDQIRAMQSIRDAVQSLNFTHGHDYIAIHSLDYVTWASNKVKRNPASRISDSIIDRAILADHRRGIDQKSEPGDSGGRDSDAAAAEKLVRVVLGDVLRAVHAHRSSGLDVLSGADRRNLVDHNDTLVRRARSRLRRAHRIRVHTLERH